jgi:glycosyltransferase involved in cell wall biosynthesis
VRLRVLHVIPAIAARYGGASVAAIESCRALATLGHEVLLVTTDADGPGHLSVPLGTTTRFDGVPVVFFRRAASESVKWSPGLSIWLRSAVVRFDVVDVHAVFSHSSLAAGRAARLARVPYVVRPHGALDPWSLMRKALRKRVLMGAGARRLLRRATRLQYTTAEEMRLAERALPWLPPGVVVPLGVDEACFDESVQPEQPITPYVLVLSRLEQKKGLELLIDVFHELAARPDLAEWRLVIAGDGEPAYVTALRRLAGAGAGRGRITFPGWVDGEQKRRLLRSASLFASPSLQENFGLAVAEAMASGIPVLMTPGVNLAPDVAAAEAGWIVERDRGCLRTALGEILSQPADRRRRGAAARRLAEGYRWRVHARMLSDLYLSMLEPASARTH